ncbi:type II toxin-antitoxin system RelE/ParE family toxin [Candidatus Woesearchaeota archaeon]|nr:type II toxin-antitoxin system RelE/ParE family toxin [Candidatus Woesearchaeota archaeon]
MWNLFFSPKAEKEFLKLPNLVQEQISNKLKGAITDPIRFFERLKGRTDYKIRAGDYRAVAEIWFDKKEIEITKVGHRKDIYDQP